ncbi:MAG: type II toxin-antitoxin system PemK/MazF family toxin, partial [Akkermansiaceae bacterium]
MTAKSRPVLVLAYPTMEDARALVIVAPLTSQIRGMRGEVEIGKPKWLPKQSAVNVQGLASFDRHVLSRKLGVLDPLTVQKIKSALRDILNLRCSENRKQVIRPSTLDLRHSTIDLRPTNFDLRPST